MKHCLFSSLRHRDKFSVMRFVGVLAAGTFLAGMAGAAAPDLAVSMCVDSVSRNTNGSYNYVVHGTVKNVGTADFVSGSNQQSLYLYRGRPNGRNPTATFSVPNLVRGAMKRVQLPVRNAATGEFVESYSMRLAFDPDLYLDSNPANDDRNSANNTATLSSETIRNAYGRAGTPLARQPRCVPLVSNQTLNNAQINSSVISRVGTIGLPGRVMPVHRTTIRGKLSGGKLFLVEQKPAADGTYDVVGAKGLIQIRGGRIVRNTLTPAQMKALRAGSLAVAPMGSAR